MQPRRSAKILGKVEPPLTPMIDIVFQLLVFFVMTFRIVSAEGDFNIRMPVAAVKPGIITEELPPIRIRLRAAADGSLASLALNSEPLSLEQLHAKILGILGTETGPGSIQELAEVELDSDYNLNYEAVVDTITAVSGYKAEDGKVVKLVERIKFAPLRPEG